MSLTELIVGKNGELIETFEDSPEEQFSGIPIGGPKIIRLIDGETLGNFSIEKCLNRDDLDVPKNANAYVIGGPRNYSHEDGKLLPIQFYHVIR